MNDESYIKKCIELAKKSEIQKEIPVGALLIIDNDIIFESHNSPICDNDPTSHAEINVIRRACSKINNYRLNNATLYISLEPCIMCIGAIGEARIDRVIFGAYADNEKKFNEKISFYKRNCNVDHMPEFVGGILKDDCSLIIKDFFKRKRS
tara:strand:+ start:58 stop:510 length:453 start_codon:yes stop_codon:yes gene_type:complete